MSVNLTDEEQELNKCIGNLYDLVLLYSAVWLYAYNIIIFSNTTINLTDAEQELNKYSGYVYDAVWLYAYALDALIK